MPSQGGPVFGFNSDVSYRQQTYHVQTENMAEGPHPTINTLVFVRGALVKKITSSCSDLADPERLEARVKRQHLEVLNRIKRGELG